MEAVRNIFQPLSSRRKTENNTIQSKDNRITSLENISQKETIQARNSILFNLPAKLAKAYEENEQFIIASKDKKKITNLNKLDEHNPNIYLFKNKGKKRKRKLKQTLTSSPLVKKKEKYADLRQSLKIENIQQDKQTIVACTFLTLDKNKSTYRRTNSLNSSTSPLEVFKTGYSSINQEDKEKDNILLNYNKIFDNNLEEAKLFNSLSVFPMVKKKKPELDSQFPVKDQYSKSKTLKQLFTNKDLNLAKLNYRTLQVSKNLNDKLNNIDLTQSNNLDNKKFIPFTTIQNKQWLKYNEFKATLRVHDSQKHNNICLETKATNKILNNKERHSITKEDKMFNPLENFYQDRINAIKSNLKNSLENKYSTKPKALINNFDKDFDIKGLKIFSCSPTDTNINTNINTTIIDTNEAKNKKQSKISTFSRTFNKNIKKTTKFAYLNTKESEIQKYPSKITDSRYQKYAKKQDEKLIYLNKKLKNQEICLTKALMNIKTVGEEITKNSKLKKLY